MKFILVIIIYAVNFSGNPGDPDAHPVAPAITTVEFENLQACETALAEVGRRRPARTQWTAFCQPKGLPKVLKKVPEEKSQ